MLKHHCMSNPLPYTDITSLTSDPDAVSSECNFVVAISSIQFSI